MYYSCSTFESILKYTSNYMSNYDRVLNIEASTQVPAKIYTKFNRRVC
jgi:hypothetical protein